MNDSQSAFERGTEVMKEVYAGDTVDLPEGLSPFFDVMAKTLFAEVWPRDVLSMRDKRLLVMATLVTRGGAAGWKIQARAALRRGEVTPAELRETLIILAQYAGFAQLADFGVLCEEVIAEFDREQKTGDRSASSSQRDRITAAGLNAPDVDSPDA